MLYVTKDSLPNAQDHIKVIEKYPLKKASLYS